MKVDVKGIINARTRNGIGAKKYKLSTDYDFEGLKEYPRPQMMRNSYINLNGQWDLVISSATGRTLYNGEITVPFSPEARLSGVGHMLMPGQTMLYKRTVMLQKKPEKRIILHFGACDQIAHVDLNGQYIGRHDGGYTAFSFDITDAAIDGKNLLSVMVTDDTDRNGYGRGKQKLRPGGMFYTAQSGIWQTVWIEYVDDVYIKRMEVTPDIDRGQVTIKAYTDADVEDVVISIDNDRVEWEAEYYSGYAETADESVEEPPVLSDVSEEMLMGTGDDNSSETLMGTGDDSLIEESTTGDVPMESDEINQSGEMAEGAGINQSEVITATTTGTGDHEEDHQHQQRGQVTIVVHISNYELWTPENPKLYYFSLKAGKDVVSSYFAMRSITTEPDEKGHMRICLNHKPIFINGVLDQGYYPESLMTPPSEQAMVDDIKRAFKAGFNLIRKHCKIEPMRWYYHCDRLGMLVCQDMINGGKKYDMKTICYMPAIYHPWKKQSDKTRFILNASGRSDSDTIKIWKREIYETVTQLVNFPSICMWTVFNEGWGQFDSRRCTEYMRTLDSTRIFDSASGWFDQGCGDIYSDHNYFFELTVLPDKYKRAFMISEYGGYSLQIEGHIYKNNIYGYHPCFTKKQFIADCKKTQEEIKSIIDKGLAGAIFTQLTDIEEEQNGLYTYDRKITKFM